MPLNVACVCVFEAEIPFEAFVQFVESKLPQIGAPKSDSYEGDGYVIVRDPDTEVVKQAMTAIIETIQVDYA